MPDVIHLVDGHAAARAALAQQAATAAATRIRSFEGWYDSAAITAMCDQIVSEIEALQRTTAKITDAYLARVLTILRGKTVAPVGAISVVGLRAGISHAGAYGRLADQFRYEVSQGTAEREALEHVVTRSGVMASTDTDLAFRGQAQKLMVVKRVDGYRRIVHPELSKDGTCGLCIAASNVRYDRGTLMPLHGRCECTVLPIVNGQDPGRDLNAQDLRDLYAKAGSTKAADLKRVRYIVHEHGELGPQLRAHGDDFRGPADVAADTDSRTAA